MFLPDGRRVRSRKKVPIMSFSIARLLLHSSAVPPEARDALETALASAPEERDAGLEQAVALLYNGTDIACSDARELVGLAPCGSCA